MSLRSEERELRAEHRRLLARRARAIRRANLSNAARLGRLARKVWQQVISIHRRRVGVFRPAMLDGHPGNITDATKRLIALAYQWAEHKGTVCTITATTDGSHATHSFHFPDPPDFPLGRAADVNFATEELEREFAEYVRRELGDEAMHRLFYELLSPADWGLYSSGFGGPDLNHRGANAHDHCAPKPAFQKP